MPSNLLSNAKKCCLEIKYQLHMLTYIKIRRHSRKYLYVKWSLMKFFKQAFCSELDTGNYTLLKNQEFLRLLERDKLKTFLLFSCIFELNNSCGQSIYNLVKRTYIRLVSWYAATNQKNYSIRLSNMNFAFPFIGLGKSWPCHFGWYLVFLGINWTLKLQLIKLW